MIYLQFSARPTIYSRLVSAVTWSWATHVDFVLHNGFLLGAASDGVKIRPPARDYSRVAYYRVPGAPCDVIERAKSQLDKPYDWTAILGFVARRNWQEDDRWFCSELVAWAFAREGRPLLAGDFSVITPRDLLLSTKLRPIGELPAIYRYSR